MSELFIQSTASKARLALREYPDGVLQVWVQDPDGRGGYAVQLDGEQRIALAEYLAPAEPVTLIEGAFDFTEGHETILDEAQRIVHGPRRTSYGHPRVNFGRIAFLWNAWLQAKTLESGVEIPVDLLDDTDVAQMMIHLKQCRLIQNPSDRDGHTDIVGYAACSAIINEIDPS